MKRLIYRAFSGAILRLERWRVATLGSDLELELKKRALRTSADLVVREMQRAKPFPQPVDVLNYALDLLGPRPSGLVLEFGVFEGRSLRLMHQRLGGTIYGFDSFQGLPEDWLPGRPKGYFAMSGVPTMPEGVQLVPGWFHETLPAFIAQHPGPVSFLHIDCDLYASTKTIFENLGEKIVAGTILVFDDFFNYPGWENGEARAFAEFLGKGRRCEYLAYCSNHMQVAIQMLN